MSVYFVQAGPYVKIGYSADPISRATSVTRLGTRPDDLPRGADSHLFGWIPGDLGIERDLHARFHDCRVAGEWFSIAEDEVRGLIWAHPYGVDVDRLSALAVFVMHTRPECARDDIVAAGLPLLAAPAEEAVGGLLAAWRAS